jgi:hypothetical protein
MFEKSQALKWRYVFFPNENIPNKIFPNNFSLTTFSTQSARFSLMGILPNNGPKSWVQGAAAP